MRITEFSSVPGSFASGFDGARGILMRNALFDFAIAVTMTTVFVVMLWGVQVGASAATAVRVKTGTYAVTSDHYMPIQRLQPVY
jgi:uncharacterized membrane protein YqgA involved in biofilm formation